ncbi:unnamed protein product, partial [marine sediment metagenome]
LPLDSLDTTSKPAKHAHTLTGHLNTFLSVMQAYYAGALGIGFLNIFYAPFLKGMSASELKQEAQYLIFQCSQNAFSRGGQSLFIDVNIHLEVPEYLKKVDAIGPGGTYTGKKYGDYEKETRAFAYALMEVWDHGDENGRPFSFPKMDLHISENAFKDPEQKKLLDFACAISSRNGSPYFIYDRDAEATLSMCCRLRSKITDKNMIAKPEILRRA